MQIDFHHAVTYLAARLAGFQASEADIIAYSAQYVDDATLSGTVAFDNDMMYTRISSAHQLFDYRNMESLATHQVWLPFHFLPGNLGEPAPAAPPALSREEYLLRCVCRPGSPVARDMMYDVIRRQDRPYALHRLGIAAHVYFDTWAHQGFVGFQHAINRARNVTANDAHHAQPLAEKLKLFFGQAWDAARSDFVGDVLPLGHGAVLSYPDRPYLNWSYTNGLGKTVQRNNPADFYAAIVSLHDMLCRYRAYALKGEGAFAEASPGIPAPVAAKIQDAIATTRDEDETVRHRAWLDKIAGHGFGLAERVDYAAKGRGSWKFTALGIEDGARDDPIYPATPQFFQSNWKLFHDALQAHRFEVVHNILPAYGICAA